MSKETAVATREADAPRLREPHVRRVVDAARASHNANTRRNYHAAWRRFQAWADRRVWVPCPRPRKRWRRTLPGGPTKACPPHRPAWTGP